MKKNTTDEMDQLIKKAIQEEFDSIEPPIPSREAWFVFTSNKKKCKWKNIFSTSVNRKFIYIVCAVIFITIFMMTPQSGSALGKISKMFNKLQGNVVQLFVKDSEADYEKSSLPSDEFSIVDGSEAESVSMDLEQAEQVTTFPILLPTWLPEGVSLNEIVAVLIENEKSEEVYLNYSGDNIEFTIRQMDIAHAFGLGAAVDQDDIRIDEIIINGHTGNLFIHKNGIIELVWMTNSSYLSIDGVISKDEIIKIAESM